MTGQKDFGTALEGFLKAAQAKVDERFAEFAPLQRGKLVHKVGEVYVRVIIESYVNEHVVSRSIYCFIDIKTGNVLKAKNLRAPIKTNPRSNIFAEDFGASGVTGRGTVYLRR